jgi:hypothetical protein
VCLRGEPIDVASPDWAVAPKGYWLGSLAFVLLGTAVGAAVGLILAVAIVGVVFSLEVEHGAPGIIGILLIIWVVIAAVVAITLATVGTWCGYLVAQEIWYGRVTEEPEPAGQNLADFYQTRAED